DVGQPREARDLDLKEKDVLTIAYDDLFERRFESRYERIQGKWKWLGDSPPERQLPHAVESSSSI
ncbi:MAG: hypothetical protein Q7U96_05010, partial [Chloroflexota bacterium]|nr:hypothetical protein [Chloroflexota bacterium]